LAVGPGTRLGVYDVIAQIGEGGMGQVKTLPAIFRLKAEATPPQRGGCRL